MTRLIDTALEKARAILGTECGPIGLDLGDQSSGEIAVAILAEVIAVRRGGWSANRLR